MGADVKPFEFSRKGKNTSISLSTTKGDCSKLFRWAPSNCTHKLAPVKTIDYPDRMIFDLDQHRKCHSDATQVRRTKDLRQRLRRKGLESTLKMRALKGLHVIVRLTGKDKPARSESLRRLAGR